MNLNNKIVELDNQLENDPENQELILERNRLLAMQKINEQFNGSLFNANSVNLSEVKPVIQDSPLLSELKTKRDKLAAKILKFGFTELQPELDNLNLQIEGIANQDTSQNLKKYDTHFGQAIWDRSLGKITCRGCEFTESEILAVSNAGLSMSEMDFEIKKHFPAARLSVTERMVEV